MTELLLINGNKVSEVICLNCMKRWISARPVDTRLTLLECPNCGLQGFAIETGETTTAEELMHKVEERNG